MLMPYDLFFLSSSLTCVMVIYQVQNMYTFLVYNEWLYKLN